MKLLSSIISSIKFGPGEIKHFKGGLIRYYVEDALANEIDNHIEDVFKIDLRKINQCKKAELHFLVYYRNLTFFFSKFTYITWNVFLAYLKNDGKTTEVYLLPKKLAIFNDVMRFFYLLLSTIYRVTSNFSLFGEHSLSKSYCKKDTLDAVNIAVQYYHGTNPAKRSDLFVLEGLNKNLEYKCFIFTNTKSNYKKLCNELALFENDIKNSYGFNIELIAVHLNTVKLNFLWRSLMLSLKLFKKFDLNLIRNPLILLSMVIFNHNKISYREFFKACKIEKVTSTNFSYNSSVISGAAFDVNVTSIFKEVSVWGDWSTVNINKIICNEWLSLTKGSASYAKNTHVFVDKIGVSKSKKLLFSRNKKSHLFRIFILGTNAGKNDSFFAPQTISSELYSNNLNAFFNWGIKKNDVKITVKEKKADSDFYLNTLKKTECTEKSKHEKIEFIANPFGRALLECCDGYDLYIALGTFYPSSIYEISDYVSRDQLVFWDIAGLSQAFPMILETTTMNVCTSLDGLINFCEGRYHDHRQVNTKSTRKLF
tara:strand:+ start:2010 stop:3626 length:1617 start_codon:yes stop_codon:yes gene_type:complete